MKKINYLCLAAGLTTLASCSSDDFLGGVFSSEKGNGEISFGTSTKSTTRDAVGKDAADKLSSEFVVYGFKSNGFTPGTSGSAGTYANDPAPEDVFQNYVVKWKGEPGSTESNTNGWEYVGYTSRPIGGGDGVDQYIKYWDYTAAQYDFLAWSVKGNATIEAIKNDGVNPFKPHSLVFTAPSADDLAKVYVANQETVKKSDAALSGGTDPQANRHYSDKVLFTFRNMAAKVRIGLYETVPGYSVKDVTFYKNATAHADANKATLFATSDAFTTAGTVTAKFYDGSEGTENDVVAETAASEVSSFAQFNVLTNYAGKEYLQDDDDYIGRASNEATMSKGTDGADGWTYEFPMNATELNLKVDYTLVSIDGSGETIKVTGASAKVPANYGVWKANYAYTYLFKISDNTNGTTGGSTDPVGLYPITFDAVVVATQDGNTQETITEVANMPITTYQNGSKITDENEYHASTSKYIYVNNSIYDMTVGDTKLYTAIDLGSDKEGITEETVANYMNNDIILTDVSSKLSNANKIPADETIDNVDVNLNKAGVRFLPDANTVYVIEYSYKSKKAYKVIKVEITSTPTATYTLAAKTDNPTTIDEGGSTIITVKNNEKVVTGAQNYFTGASDFTITESTTTPGEYTLVAKAGTTQGAKSIQLNNCTALAITVNAYEFASSAKVTITEGGSNTITLNLGNAAATDVDAADGSEATTAGFEITGDGLSIFKVEDGVVNIAAANGAKSGKITFSNNNVVVATADVIVKNYSLAVKDGSYAIINGTGSTTTLVAKLGSDFATAGTTLTSSPTGVVNVAAVAGDAGEAVVTYAGVGTTDITLGSATQTIECTNFEVKFYTNEDCTTEATGNLTKDIIYYAQFTDNGTAKNVTGLTSEGCTLTKKSADGVYKVTVSAAGTATIKYTYNGVTFTLATKTVVAQ